MTPASTARSVASGRDAGGLIAHRITDLDSFTRLTEGQRAVAGLYFYQQLDCLVELAYAVTSDFFKRPDLYVRLEHDHGSTTPLPRLLAKLHSRCGTEETLPSDVQREVIYTAIFGSGGAHSATEEGDFPHLRDRLLATATAFAQRAVESGVDMLRQAVRDAQLRLAAYLAGVTGDSIQWSRESALPVMTEETCYAILRSRSIAAIFGIGTPPARTWPYAENSNGDKLVEKISIQLGWTEQSGSGHMTRERISNLQQTALRGTEAIAAVIDLKDPSNEADFDQLITKCYRWGTTLLAARTPVSQRVGASIGGASTAQVQPGVSQPHAHAGLMVDGTR